MKFPIIVFLILFVVACEPEKPPAPAELTDLLAAGATEQDIADHLLEAEHMATPTRALVAHYGAMDREQAYDVQLVALEKELARNKRLIGWKMGGTRVADSTGSPDPSFAYILSTDSLADGQTLPPDPFVGDSVLVEAEVAFIMGQDLPGPVVSEDELSDAVESVVGAIELISIRVLPGPAGVEPTTNHMIAARLSHAGVILGNRRVPLSEFDLAGEQAVALIDGEERASGRSNQIMNADPFEGLMWIANALPKHGRHLRAGDVVITGSLYDNPTLKPGQEATIRFSTLGRVSVSLADPVAAD